MTGRVVVYIINMYLILTIMVSLVDGCSTTTKAPVRAPVPVVSPPPYAFVPHPAAPDKPDMMDVKAIFLDATAPASETLKECDADFWKLRKATRNEQERADGVNELVRNDPVRNHWCFYSKVIDLEDKLSKQIDLEERQKLVLDTFLYLSSVGKAFIGEYHDSRYMRWSVAQYRRLSEVVFFRRLELSKEGTSELVESAKPFGLWRQPSSKGAVLEKYNLISVQTTTSPTATTAPVISVAAPSPSSLPSPSPSVSPVPGSTASVDPSELPLEDEVSKPARAIGSAPEPEPKNVTNQPKAVSKTPVAASLSGKAADKAKLVP